MNRPVLALLAALVVALSSCSSTHRADPSPSAAGGGTPVEATAVANAVGDAIERGGFVTEIENGRLWVMRTGQQKSEKCITWIGAGPQRMTLRAPDAETALAYLGARPGFVTEAVDGRLWVLREGQEKSEKRITKVGAGPRGCTVLAPDRETLEAWLAVR